MSDTNSLHDSVLGEHVRPPPPAYQPPPPAYQPANASSPPAYLAPNARPTAGLSAVPASAPGRVVRDWDPIRRTTVYRPAEESAERDAAAREFITRNTRRTTNNPAPGTGTGTGPGRTASFPASTAGVAGSSASDNLRDLEAGDRSNNRTVRPLTARYVRQIFYGPVGRVTSWGGADGGGTAAAGTANVASSGNSAPLAARNPPASRLLKNKMRKKTRRVLWSAVGAVVLVCVVIGLVAKYAGGVDE